MKKIIMIYIACVAGAIAMYIYQCMSVKKLPYDVQNIPFGTVFTDHIFVMEWTKEMGWHNSRIEPYHAFEFDPALISLHYGAEIFEGMKAFKTPEGRPVLFRPRDHLHRMNISASRMCMPEIDVDHVLGFLKKLVRIDAAWIPQEPGTALYIRPTMIAAEPTINLKVSDRFLFYILLSPAGAIYKEGFNPTSIMVTEKYARAAVGGVGAVKTGGNYAASMKAQQEAKTRGFSQVLWLDPQERKYVEEVGSMNIFFMINNELVTPSLNGTILPGITRKSIIELAKSWGLPLVERRISIDEVIQSIQDGSCTEIFGTGTAAGIAPVGKLAYNEHVYTINNNATGPVTQRFYDVLTGIQRGQQPDLFNWLVTV